MKTNLGLYTCSLCKKDFDFREIRYASDGKRIVCLDCFKSMGKIEKQKTEEGTLEVPSKKDEVGLFCIGCGYRFQFKKSSRGKLMCPYCGGENLIKDETTAEMLIRNLV